MCENPAVLRRACAELGAACPPLVCTEGRPSTAFHRLVGLAVGAGAELWYHGDFDWPGLAIAADVIARYGGRPWRMGASDYLAALPRSGPGVALAGEPTVTPWDMELPEAMRTANRAVYEESTGDQLVADLEKESQASCLSSLRAAGETAARIVMTPAGGSLVWNTQLLSTAGAAHSKRSADGWDEKITAASEWGAPSAAGRPGRTGQWGRAGRPGPACGRRAVPALTIAGGARHAGAVCRGMVAAGRPGRQCHGGPRASGGRGARQRPGVPGRAGSGQPGRLRGGGVLSGQPVVP